MKLNLSNNLIVELTESAFDHVGNVEVINKFVEILVQLQCGLVLKLTKKCINLIVVLDVTTEHKNRNGGHSKTLVKEIISTKDAIIFSISKFEYLQLSQGKTVKLFPF